MTWLPSGDWLPDPRLGALGQRMVLPARSKATSPNGEPETEGYEYRAWRIEHGVAEGSTEIASGIAKSWWHIVQCVYLVQLLGSNCAGLLGILYTSCTIQNCLIDMRSTLFTACCNNRKHLLHVLPARVQYQAGPLLHFVHLLVAKSLSMLLCKCWMKARSGPLAQDVFACRPSNTSGVQSG